MMTHFDSSGKKYLVREGLSQAHNVVWQKIAAPGSWWRGEDRVARIIETTDL